MLPGEVKKNMNGVTLVNDPQKIFGGNAHPFHESYIFAGEIIWMSSLLKLFLNCLCIFDRFYIVDWEHIKNFIIS